MLFPVRIIAVHHADISGDIHHSGDHHSSMLRAHSRCHLAPILVDNDVSNGRRTQQQTTSHCGLFQDILVHHVEYENISALVLQYTIYQWRRCRKRVPLSLLAVKKMWEKFSYYFISKFSSSSAEFEAENSHFVKHLKEKLKFYAPVIFCVGNLQLFVGILSESCDFLSRLFLTHDFTAVYLVTASLIT